MNVAKIQSDREYKKGYEASKTRYHTPLDMFSVTAAKKSQEVATNTNYRQPYHNYTLLPDALNVEHSRNAMQIQSDVCTRWRLGWLISIFKGTMWGGYKGHQRHLHLAPIQIWVLHVTHCASWGFTE